MAKVGGRGGRARTLVSPSDRRYRAFFLLAGLACWTRPRIDFSYSRCFRCCEDFFYFVEQRSLPIGLGQEIRARLGIFRFEFRVEGSGCYQHHSLGRMPAQVLRELLFRCAREGSCRVIRRSILRCARFLDLHRRLRVSAGRTSKPECLRRLQVASRTKGSSSARRMVRRREQAGRAFANASVNGLG